MFRFYPFFTLFFISLLFSCNAERKADAMDQINANVRSYFALPDSNELSVVVLDTIQVEDLTEMLDQVNKNLNLIDDDLDTLSLMIDDRAYAALDIEQELDKKLLLNRHNLTDSLHKTTITKLEYQLKQAQLLAKKQLFKQTNRLLLHLKRSVKNNLAGYNIAVQYSLNDELLNVELLLDANLTVVD